MSCVERIVKLIEDDNVKVKSLFLQWCIYTCKQGNIYRET